MTLAFSNSSTSAIAASVPRWAVEMFTQARQRSGETLDGMNVSVAEADELALVTVTVPSARHVPATEFEKLTATAYALLQQNLQAAGTSHPVRVWNHIPDIHAPSPTGIDRYMAFNAGRFQAYSQWLGGTGSFDRTVPAASAVGHDGDDFLIHAMGSRSPGIPVVNSRQIAPHRYSRRFGPLPPCFARATVLPQGLNRPASILVGGTASIRGEESIHVNDIREQTSETFHNLAHLIRAASLPTGHHANGMTPTETRDYLSHYLDLRVYYLQEKDLPFIESRMKEEFATTCRVEYMRANLCRAELLVEIEGLARV